MTDRTMRALLFACVLAGCADAAPKPEPECEGESCEGSSPDDANDDDDERDASADARVGVADAGKTSGPAPRRDAAPDSTAVDAGEETADAAQPAPTTDGGATAPSGAVKSSAGCGAAMPTAGESTIDVMGTARAYILTLPKSYDASKPYKLVFAWHGLGGTAAQIARSYYGLQAQSNDGVIFVAGQGLQTSNSVGSGPGWPNTNGQDVAFVKALYAKLQTTVCIDENRVFSVGMSYGGIMSNTLGCQMGDVFRAIAPIAGSGPGFGARGATCVGQVATWLAHGDNDTVVSTASGVASRDFWAKANHCQTTTVPTEPSPCVAYDGCDEGHPVTWCQFVGGHTVPPFASKAIWNFFSQF